MCPQDDFQRRRGIIESIQKLDTKISSFNQQKQQLLRELKSIPIIEPSVAIPEDFSPNEKVRLFKELFRGRTDVYAKHWISKKTGKSGYSPVCKNEWAPKICQKAIAKCSDCPHREFMPFDESVILRHLNGNLIAGIYPLLDGDLC